jgi:hypothetical protein
MFRTTLVAAAFCASSAGAELVNEDTASLVVQTGDVLGSRAFLQPTLGWELLIRFDDGLYICSVRVGTTLEVNGAPHIDYVKVNSCFNQLTQ